MILIRGIVSTSHVDLHNERIMKSALNCMQRDINKKLIPLLVEHDLRKQIGIFLSSKVFQLADEEFALGVVAGVFENKEEGKKFKVGSVNRYYTKYMPILNEFISNYEKVE